MLNCRPHAQRDVTTPSNNDSTPDMGKPCRDLARALQRGNRTDGSTIRPCWFGRRHARATYAEWGN
eukprot:11207819-Lingulodinium_polyedra.AAC.1